MSVVGRTATLVSNCEPVGRFRWSASALGERLRRVAALPEVYWLTRARRASATRATCCPSIVAGKNGSASERAATCSQAGKGSHRVSRPPGYLHTSAYFSGRRLSPGDRLGVASGVDWRQVGQPASRLARTVLEAENRQSSAGHGVFSVIPDLGLLGFRAS